MGLFSKQQLSIVPIYGSGRYFKKGEYLVKITDTIFKEGYKGETAIIEAVVIAVDTDDDDAPGPGVTASQVISLDGDKEKVAMGYSKLMHFATVVYDCEQDDMTDEEWDATLTATFTEKNLNGVYMRLSCFEVEAKKKPGEVYTNHKWLNVATEKDFASFGLSVPEDYTP